MGPLVRGLFKTRTAAVFASSSTMAITGLVWGGEPLPGWHSLGEFLGSPSLAFRGPAQIWCEFGSGSAATRTQHHQQRLQQRGSSPPAAGCLLWPPRMGGAGKGSPFNYSRPAASFLGTSATSSVPPLAHNPSAQLSQLTGDAGAPSAPRAPLHGGEARQPPRVPAEGAASPPRHRLGCQLTCCKGERRLHPKHLQNANRALVMSPRVSCWPCLVPGRWSPMSGAHCSPERRG